MPFSRASGILVHPTSLPDGRGIGDLGSGAYRFIDFLSMAGQALWQILPLGPTGHGNSPYSALSAFAGNPLLISLEQLVRENLLTASELGFLPPFPPDRVDYQAVAAHKETRLRRAYYAFVEGKASHLKADFAAFCKNQAAWLDDYALYATLKTMNDGRPWYEWGNTKNRSAISPKDVDRESFDFYRFTQFLFDQQWSALRDYARERGIQIIGDIPIFVARDSADVWANPDIFYLDEEFRPTVVAGVPPDFFSATGQLWGNPLYRWDVLEQTGYRWWINRLRATLRTVDIIRFDHFRGFQAYWEVPASAETAAGGRWVPGPGTKFFTAIRDELGDVPLIVEDLGLITPDVHALREGLGYPGMKVLQFAFGDDASNPYLPHNYERNYVVYTGTHDNDTTVGWFAQLGTEERSRVQMYLGTDGHDIAWDMIRVALRSVASTAIIPLQDVLGLGNEARMNMPGVADGNWAWRCPPGLLEDEPAGRLRTLSEIYGRVSSNSDIT